MTDSNNNTMKQHTINDDSGSGTWRDRAKRRKLLDAQAITSTSTVLSPTQTAIQYTNVNNNNNNNNKHNQQHQHDHDTHNDLNINNNHIVHSDICESDDNNNKQTHFAGLSDNNNILPDFIQNYINQLKQHDNNDVDNSKTKQQQSFGNKQGTIKSGSDKINELSAQALKAKLKRNMTLCNELEEQIEQIKKQHQNDVTANDNNNNVVVLDELNQQNIPYKLINKYNTINQQQDSSITGILRQEKLYSADVYDQQQYKTLKNIDVSKMTNTDDIYDVYNEQILNNKFHIAGSNKDSNTIRSQQIQQSIRKQDNCNACNLPPYTILSHGINTLLHVTHINKFLQYQYNLTTLTHSINRLDLSIDTIDEINHFKTTLCNAFEQYNNQTCIFIEQYNHLKPTHYNIHVCVVDINDINTIKSTYISEIQLLDISQTNHSRNLIDLSKTNNTNLTHYITQYRSYYMIQFDTNIHNTILHLLNTDEQYDELYCLRILCSYSEQPDSIMLRNKQVSKSTVLHCVDESKKIYNSKYDWTKQLNKYTLNK